MSHIHYKDDLSSIIRLCGHREIPDKLHFLTVDANTPAIIISADVINSHTLVNELEHLLKQAAECLREDILEHAQSIPDLAWPPRIKELSCDAR